VLQDGFGRNHDDLRISVTDRCNLRCTYCMPEEPTWYPRSKILRFEEIERLARIFAGLGVRKLRMTGGEPLLRHQFVDLVAALARLDGVEDLSLTTNGMLLDRMAAPLHAAGLRRVNVSIDTLDREHFRRITRRDVLPRVLKGLAAASAAGLTPIKVNTVLIRGDNEDEIDGLVEAAREHGWELRFIEFMPLENGGSWDRSRIVPGAEVRERIDKRWPLRPDPDADPHAPAARWLFADGAGAVGFIDSVSRPFCGECSRLRLTADGKLRVCLYDSNETDLRDPMRKGASDSTLIDKIHEAVAGKGRGGAVEILETQAPLPLERTMHQIGG